MDEQFCDVGGGITLCYETFGEEDAPPLLLVMGLATQMIGWHEDFCAQLADRGFRVIRFDNRDIGRSTHLEGVRGRRRGRSSAATSEWRPTRSPTWPTTQSGCSTRSAPRPPTWSAHRWAG